MCFAPQRRALLRYLSFHKWSEAEAFCALLLGNVLCATTVYTFSTSQLAKVLRTWCVLPILIPKSASRHREARFFHISTSKSAPVFFKTLLLRNVLRPTTVRTFGTSELPNVLRHWGVLAFWLRNLLRATTACNFLISHLPRWLRARRFSEPTFRPSGATKHGQNAVFRDFFAFLRTCIFFLLTVSLLWSSFYSFSDSFSSLTLSTSAFPSVHIVGSLASKLPSVMVRSIL